jgi:hypothetical protein
MLEKGVAAIKKGFYVFVKPGNPVRIAPINAKRQPDKIPAIWALRIFNFFNLNTIHFPTFE